MNFSNSSIINLSFDYAYTLWTNPNSNEVWSDTLIILISTDCGLSWQKIWEEAGTNLVTTNPVYHSTEWFPASNNDWQSININLNNYSNQDGVIVKFRNVNQYENNLFIDNINISSNGSASVNQINLNKIEVYPNPADKNVNMMYNGLKEIYNIFGEKVMESFDENINISHLSKGIYFIKIEDISIRLIKL